MKIFFLCLTLYLMGLANAETFGDPWFNTSATKADIVALKLDISLNNHEETLVRLTNNTHYYVYGSLQYSSGQFIASFTLRPSYFDRYFDVPLEDTYQEHVESICSDFGMEMQRFVLQVFPNETAISLVGENNNNWESLASAIGDRLDVYLTLNFDGIVIQQACTASVSRINDGELLSKKATYVEYLTRLGIVKESEYPW